MLVPGACVIVVLATGPSLTLAQWGSRLSDFGSFLAVSVGGVAVIVLAIRQAMRR
jgi:hypothetical protein